MKVFIFRHGHKEFSATEDPSLSPRGFEQAKNLGTLISKQMLPVPTHCWYSEKIRTRQTLEHSFNNSGVHTFEKSELNVREHDEDLHHFRHRILKFLTELSLRTPKNEVHFVCTHFDWIEESLTIIKSDRELNTYELSSWAPGQYVQFELQDQIYHYIKKGVI